MLFKDNWKKAGALKVGDIFSPEPHNLSKKVKITKLLKGKVTEANGAYNTVKIIFEYTDGQVKGVAGDRVFQTHENIIWYPKKKAGAKLKVMDICLLLLAAYSLGWATMGAVVHYGWL